MLTNFSYVVPELAGCALPTSEEAYEELRKKGIGAAVQLRVAYQNAGDLGVEYLYLPIEDFEYLYLPIEDYHAPTHEQIETFVQFVVEQYEEGRAVVVHCLTGQGCTGTMLAAHLIHGWRITAFDAINSIREIRPGSVESAQQVAVLYAMQRRLGYE